MLVDNRAGAGGNVATELTVRAAPDGYTVTLCTIAHAITPARMKLPFDSIRDFSFISMVGSMPNLLMAHPSQPFKNVGDIVAYAKANPGKLSFGTSGVGASPHLSMELLKSMTGTSRASRTSSSVKASSVPARSSPSATRLSAHSSIPIRTTSIRS